MVGPVQSSVIIPTYNRRQVLNRTLQSLAAQTLTPEELEVIVIDNGSTDDTHLLAEKSWPWRFKLLRQSIQGPTEARNLGASTSSGQMLIFLDDDICPQPTTLQALIETCQAHQRTICLGTLIVPKEIIQSSIYARTINQSQPQEDQEIPFSFCQTGLLAVKRTDFELIGGFKDPTGGWPNWDDVDFGFRAHRLGFHFLRIAGAVGVHWDYSIQNLQVSYNRLYRASQSAPRLIIHYPELRSELTMFMDSYPIDIKRDSLVQIIRKITRHFSAARPILWAEEQAANGFERLFPAPGILRPLYRWILGAYIYKGFKMGTAELNAH